MSENSTDHCSNCKHDIPSANYQIHSIHCKRNIQLCPLCNECIPRAEFENHKKEFHSIITCSKCGEKLETFELEKHQKETCKKRILPCQHCDLELRADDIEEHEDYCGSRTEYCDGCEKLIMLKFQRLHLGSNHKCTKLPKDSSDSDDDFVSAEESRDEYYSSRYEKRSDKHKHTRFRHSNSSANGDSSSRSSSDQKKKKQRSKNHDSSSELNQYFQNLDLERITNRSNAEVSEILNREQSSSNFTEAEWVHETFIPCEFCDTLISADELVLHQTGCRPDLSSYNQEINNSNQSWVRRINQNDDEDPYDAEELVQYVPNSRTNEEAIIPCEFCLQLYSSDDISNHQYICRRNNYLNF